MEAFNGAGDQQPYPDFMGAITQGAQQGQTLRGISALQNIDINDPASLNKGIAAGVRAGMMDQMSALMGLQINRSLYSGLPGFLSQATASQSPVTTAGGVSPQGGAPAPNAPQGGVIQPAPGGGSPDASQAPDQLSALHAQVAQDARAYAAASPTDQATMKPQLEAKYSKLGIPQQAIDSALQTVSTPEGAGQFADMHDAHAQGYATGQADPAAIQSSLPAGMQPPPQGDAQASYAWAKNYLSHPEWSTYEAMLKSRMNLDLGLTARAQAIMGPEFGAEATARNAANISGETARGSAPYGLDTVTLPDGSTAQVPHNLALTLGKAGALHGLTPQAEAEQKSAGAASGSAPYDMVTMTGPNGETVQMSRAQMAAMAKNGGLPTGPGIASKTDMAGQAQNLNTEADAAKQRLTQVPQNLAKGQALLGLANTIGTGKYTGALSTAAQYLPATHSLKDYATSSSLLTQDLKGTFQQALNGLSVPRVAVEARSILGGIPTSSSPQDQVKVYAAGLLASTQYAAAHDQFLQNWAADTSKPRSLAQADAAWQAGPGKASLFAMPAWQGIMVGGKPAISAPRTAKNGASYVQVLPGLLKDPPIVRAQ